MSSSRALTTTYSLMKLLSPINASPVLVRSLRTSTLPVTSSDSDSNSESDTPTSCWKWKQPPPPPPAEVCPLVNRFLKEGPEIPYGGYKDDKAMFAWLDMPGIGNEGLKLWVENNSLYIKAVEEVEEKEDDDPLLAEECPRKYYGHINLPRGRYKAEETMARLRNGMLLIMVPKIKLEDRKDVINVSVK